MTNELKVKIILRHDLTKGWTIVKDSVVLSKGELGVEFLTSEKNTIFKIKIGNGTSSWENLSYSIPEIELPNKYTWNDLLGVDIEKEATYTQLLALKKPGYSDVVNIKDLNDNYELIDSAVLVLNSNIKELNGIINSLITNYPEGENISLETELKNIRIRHSGDEYPSAGSAVRAIDAELAELSRNLSNLTGSAIPDGLYYKDSQLYLTANNEIISDPVTIVSGSGGGGSGGNLTYTISLTNLLDSRVISIPSGNPVVLEFNYTSQDEEGYSDGEGTGTLFVNSIQQTVFFAKQGDNTLDITKYLKNGTNTVKIQVTNSEGSYRSLSYTVNILTLSITTSSSLMSSYNVESFSFQYTVNGSGTKKVHFIIDGELKKIETVDSSGQSRQYLINRLPDGPHILEIYATVDSEGGEVKSNTIRAGMIWYSDSTVDPIILINSTIKEVTQGDSITIPFMVFHPSYERVQIKQEIISEDGTVFSTKYPEVGRASSNWEIHTYPIGNTTFRITCEAISEEIKIKVNKSSFDREVYTDNLLLEFNARDRSNLEKNPESWNYGDIEATFENIGWSTIDGWLTDIDGEAILRLLPQSSMFIPFKPFSSNIINSGYTIEVELATQNVCDYDSIVMSSYENGRGLIIKSQSASLNAEQTSINAQFKEDSKIRLAFVVEQNTTDSTGLSTSNRLIYIYINGILCGVQQYAENDNFSQTNPVGLTIGAESCGIDVYFIRFYDIAFTAEMELNNFIVDRPTLSERIDVDIRNDLLDPDASDLHKKITIDSLGGAIRYIIMKCPELPQYKGDKKKDMEIEYVDPFNPEKSFKATGCQFDVQGTSSAGYPVKNFKIKMGDGIIYTQSGAIDEDGYKFTENSLPSKTLCLKVDYASSEGANNVTLVDYYNTITPYKMPPQQVDERVRQGIYGQPIVLFWLNTETNELKFWCKANMNDDKSNENVFGFKDIDISSIIPENEQRIECWEWLNNNTALCLFQNDSEFDETRVDKEGNVYPAWQDSFEPRFPDLDEMYSEIDALRRVVSWVASTNTAGANGGLLPEPKYYRTRDTVWDKNKVYYSNQEGDIAIIEEAGTILSYNEKVLIDKNMFYSKMGATSYEDLVGGYEVIYNNSWALYKNEVIIEENISNLGDYGISISDSTITSFAFEYKITGIGWNNKLYEYYQYNTVEYRLAKFKAEFEEYFILDAITFYYIFTEVFLMIDSRAKNMFLTTFNGKHWFPIPYDMDTALGINNEGALVFDYNLEDTDIVDGSMVYNGQESVLWINFRKCFYNEIVNMYRDIRSLDGEKEFSYNAFSKKINTYQEAWAEVLWNIDQEIKYLQPFFAGTNNLAMAQGNKKAQRDFWMFGAFKYRDSKYQAGDAATNSIHLRLYNKGQIKVKPYSHIYTRVKFGNAKDEIKRTRRNEEAIFTTDGIAAVNDLETHIYSADRIAELGDLSSLQVGYCDFSSAVKLQSIIVGNESENYRNGNLKAFTVGASTLLREINLSNCYNLGLPGAGHTQTINVSQCPCLEIFKAKGTQILGVNFSNGGRLKTIELPGTITNLTLRNQTQIEELSIDSYDNISTLWLENSPNLPIENILLNTPKLERVRLYNLEWTASSEEKLKEVYQKLKKCKGLSSTGTDEATASISARVNINSISDSLLEEINGTFPELVIVVNGVPKYYIEYVNLDRSQLYYYIADGGTDVIDPVAKNLISTPAYPQTEDTIYTYKGWRNLPTNISQSYVIVADYLMDFRVQFFKDDSAETPIDVQWVREGQAAIDPIAAGIMKTPVKSPTAEFGYIFKDWGTDLTNIKKPLNLYPVFSEYKNTYTVKIYGGEKQLGENQVLTYGDSITLPNTEEVFNYYWDSEAGEYKYFPIFTHIGWDINNDGIDDGENLYITPLEYTEEPIIVRAIFSASFETEDDWETIIMSCKEGTYKEKYPLGTQKQIEFVFNGTNYTGIAEIVGQDYDVDENFQTVPLSFIMKDIFITKSIRNNSNFTWNGITGPLAGGFSQTGLYDSIKKITFTDEILETNITPILKKTDFGPLSTEEQQEYYPASNILETKWVPSATELGVLPSSVSDNEEIVTKEAASQGGDGSHEAYYWFTNNASRIKKYNGVSTKYWTRTYAADSWRLLGVGEDGGVALTEKSPGIRSFETAGVTFGFCIGG